MKKLALLTCMILLGCPSEPVPESMAGRTQQAIDGWRAAGNPWYFRCTPWQTTLTVVPDPRVYCGGDARLYGCLQGNAVYVSQSAVDQGLVDFVIEHELRHWMAGCTFGTIDGAHVDNRVWYPHRGVDIRE